MAIALDINQNGLLVETGFLIEAKYLMQIAVDHDNNLTEMKAAFVDSKQGEIAAKFKTGLNLQGTDADIAKKLIRFFLAIFRGINHLKHFVYYFICIFVAYLASSHLTMTTAAVFER